MEINEEFKQQKEGLVVAIKFKNNVVMYADDKASFRCLGLSFDKEKQRTRRLFAGKEIIVGTYGNGLMTYKEKHNNTVDKFIAIENILEDFIERKNYNLYKFVDEFQNLLIDEYNDKREFNFIVAVNYSNPKIYKIKFINGYLKEFSEIEDVIYAGGDDFYVHHFNEIKNMFKLELQEANDFVYQTVRHQIKLIKNKQHKLMEYDPVGDLFDAFSFGYEKVFKCINDGEKEYEPIIPTISLS